MLLPELPVGEFGDDVEVSEVAGVFLDQVEQDAFEGWGVGTVPAGTWFAHLCQIVGLDDGSAALGLYPKAGHEVVDCLPIWDVGFALVARAAVIEPILLNGAPGARVPLDGTVDTVIGFAFEDGRISSVFAVRNPEKLHRLSEETQLSR